jgi:HlyD family secretion protein
MKALKKLMRQLATLAVLAGIVGGGYYAYTYYNTDAQADEQQELLTVQPEVRDITVTVTATGVLQPVRIVEVKSKASGEIIDMPVETGDYLEKGQLIAQVDTRILSQELKQAEADHQSADTRLKIAQRQYDRALDLHGQDLISVNDLETSEQNYTNAEAQLLRAEASLELARDYLEDATVTAPVSGTVIAKTVEEGQVITSSMSNVSGGTTLVKMADLSELEIRTLVDEIDVGRVRPGLVVDSTVEAYPEIEFQGAVLKIEPQSVVQQSVTTFPVLSRIDNSNGLLLPGMNADVNIVIDQRHGVLVVPNEAVRSLQDAHQVANLLGLGLAGNGRNLVAGDGGVLGSLLRDPAASNARSSASAETTSSAASSQPGEPRDGALGPRAIPAAYEGGEESDFEIDVYADIEDVREPTGAVFVLGADGTLSMRPILAGINDWEFTEIQAGLNGDEELVILPSTSLLRSQEAMRERFGGGSVIPGMSGGGPGGRRMGG